MEPDREQTTALPGRGQLFRFLLDAGLVDTVEVAVMPVLLGDGVPLLPPGSATKLTLADHKTLPVNGIVILAYVAAGGVGPAPRIRYVKSAEDAREEEDGRDRF